MPVTFERRGGIQFARCAIALALSDGIHVRAARIARERWRGDPLVAEVLEKAAVAAGTTTGSGWADALADFGFASEFVQAVRYATIIDRLPGVRRVPFRSKVPVETTPAGAAWVGEGKPIPVSKSVVENVELDAYKAAVIVAFGAEFLKIARTGSEEAVLAWLVSAVASYLDEQLLDPEVAEVANVNPASITNGVTPITSTGTTAAQIADDLSDMVDALTSFVAPVWIMAPQTCVRMAALGIDRNLRINGGELFGAPVLTSKSARPVGSPSANLIVLTDGDSILLADEGRADVLAAEATAIQLLDNPTNESGGSTTATNMVSMLQTHSVAFRVTREVAWKRAHSGAVSFMEVTF